MERHAKPEHQFCVVTQIKHIDLMNAGYDNCRKTKAAYCPVKRRKRNYRLGFGSLPLMAMTLSPVFDCRIAFAVYPSLCLRKEIVGADHFGSTHLAKLPFHQRIMNLTTAQRPSVVRIEPLDLRPHLDFSSFRQSQRVFHINTKVTNGIFNLGMPKQKLDRPQITCRLVNYRCFGSPH